jgi:hypothetical protein
MSGDAIDPVGTRSRPSAMIQPQEESGDTVDPVGTRSVAGIRRLEVPSGNMIDPVGTKKPKARKHNPRRRRQVRKAAKSAKAR